MEGGGLGEMHCNWVECVMVIVVGGLELAFAFQRKE